MNYPKLFEPIRINQLTLQNRVIAAPGPIADEEAFSGAAVIGVASIPVDSDRGGIVPPGKGVSKYERMALCEDISRLRRGGSRVAVELLHCGIFARYNKAPAYGPSEYVREFDGTTAQAMTAADMAFVTEKYGEAAKIVKQIGADLILLHFAHGWLPAQFLSPHYNHRTDEYGGSLENRMKFPVRIVEAVRRAVGKDFPVYMRISGKEYVADGMPLDEVIRFLKTIESQIDLVEVSAGLDTEDDPKVHMCTTIFAPHMPNLETAAEIRRNLTIPVSVIGAVETPEEAEEALEKGYVDMVSMRRSFMADPLWLKKAYEGHPEDIVPCMRCNSCYHAATLRMRKLGCAVNLRYMNERYYPEKIEPAPVRKRVVIAGGGPAGLNAAVIAAKRGHQVILLEEKEQLGGALWFTEYDERKVDLKRYKDYIVTQARKERIDVRLGVPATREYVEKLQPDALIIAVGGEQSLPPIPGIDAPGVWQGSEAYRHLREAGENVVIVGGGTIGCELSLDFAQEGKSVVIVEASAAVAASGNHFYRVALQQEFKKHPNIAIYTETFCDQITDHSVLAHRKTGEAMELKADTVINATGIRPRVKTAESLRGICYHTYVIGDAYRAGKVENAIEDGFHVAYQL